MGVEFLQDEKEWDRWVEKEKEGRYVYLSGYLRALEETLSLPSFPLLYRSEGVIRSIFPVVLIRNLKGKRVFISLPFSEYGGPLGREGEEVLREEIIKIMKNLKVSHLEIHGGTGMREKEEYRSHPLQFRALINLGEKDLKEIHAAMDRSVKKNLRRGREEGVLVERRKNIPLSIFYPLYLRTHKRLGSPPLPFLFFQRLNYYLSPHIRCVVAKYREKVISLLLGWSVGSSLHVTHILSLPEFWHLRGNDLVHWEMLRWAREEGKEIFDFGPARYEGQIRYKKKWGAVFLPYYYHYLPPDREISPPQPGKGFWKTLSFLWRTCVPDFLSPSLGRIIRPRLGI